MNYNTFKGMILPFFLQRGADMSGGLQNIDNFIHLGLQAAALYSDWSFFRRNELVTSEKKGTKYIFRTENEIGKINFVKDKLGTDKYIDKDFKLRGDSEGTYLESDSDLMELEIEYWTEYEWISIETDGDKSLPFPNRFLPALTMLVYDAGSPLVTFEGERTPRWQIAEKYLNRLEDKDGLQESGQVSYNYE